MGRPRPKNVKKCDLFPAYRDAGLPKLEGKIQRGEQRKKVQNSITPGVSMRGKYQLYSENWLTYKSRMVSMYCNTASQRKRR